MRTAASASSRKNSAKIGPIAVLDHRHRCAQPPGFPRPCAAAVGRLRGSRFAARFARRCRAGAAAVPVAARLARGARGFGGRLRLARFAAPDDAASGRLRVAAGAARSRSFAAGASLPDSAPAASRTPRRRAASPAACSGRLQPRRGARTSAAARASRGTAARPARRGHARAARPGTRRGCPTASSEFSTLSAAFCALQRALALERAADPGVELQQAELQGHDPDQRERDDADPDPAADQAVEQPVARERVEPPRRGRSARARARPAAAGARGARRARAGAGPETRRGRARAPPRGRRGASGGAAPRAACGGGGRLIALLASGASLRAARRRAEAARGLRRPPAAEGTIERRVSSAASGSRPHAQTGRSGGQMQPRARSARKRLTRRSSSEWKEIAASTPPSRSSSQASGSALVELPELVVDGDAQRLEGALGGMPAAEAGRARGSPR